MASKIGNYRIPFDAKGNLYTTSQGQVLGTWTFVKRGSNYGLAPLLEAQ